MRAGSPNCWPGRGDSVVQGQPLFVIEALTPCRRRTISSRPSPLKQARSALDLAQIQHKRAKDLFEGKAVPLKDYQQARGNLTQAQNDLRSTQTALRRRAINCESGLHRRGHINVFRIRGSINREITIFSPIAGTVVQRRSAPANM